MRDAFHEELDGLTDGLAALCRRVGSTMGRATTALLDADVALAEMVIEADKVVDQRYVELEDNAFDLIARQQPVAGDLRLVVASIRMLVDVERCGDLASHVAKVARLRYPDCAVPDVLRSTMLEMGQAAQRSVEKVADVISTRNLDLAAEVERDDDLMDALRKRLFVVMLSPSWTYGVDTAIDIALVGRYYERFADHAVSVAKRVGFLVTGEWLPIAD